MAYTFVAEPNETKAAAVARLCAAHGLRDLGEEPPFLPDPSDPLRAGVLWRVASPARTFRVLDATHTRVIKTGLGSASGFAILRWRVPYTVRSISSIGTSPPGLDVYGEPVFEPGDWAPLASGERVLDIDIVTGGAIGVAEFRYSVSGGAVYLPEAPSPPLPITTSTILLGMDLRFGAGTFNANNAYQILISAQPHPALSLTPTTKPVAP